MSLGDRVVFTLRLPREMAEQLDGLTGHHSRNALVFRVLQDFLGKAKASGNPESYAKALFWAPRPQPPEDIPENVVRFPGRAEAG